MICLFYKSNIWSCFCSIFFKKNYQKYSYQFFVFFLVLLTKKFCFVSKNWKCYRTQTCFFFGLIVKTMHTIVFLWAMYQVLSVCMGCWNFSTLVEKVNWSECHDQCNTAEIVLLFLVRLYLQMVFRKGCFIVQGWWCDIDMQAWSLM